MASTADNAFTFRPRDSDAGWMLREWPEARNGVAGLAMVDFTLFPAVMRPWGPRERCYKWPYYFSSSPERKKSAEMLVRGFASVADHIIERTGKSVALICMEQLDEAMAHHVYRRMRHPEKSHLFSSGQYDASRMTCLLRGLDLLVTSRFHAAVLSLASAVPQVAIHHDARLSALYGDLGLKERWFLDPVATPLSGLFAALPEIVDSLLENPEPQRKLLIKGYGEHAARAAGNRRILSRFISRCMGAPEIHASLAGELDRATESKGGVAWAA
jgi:hypothetical protein